MNELLAIVFFVLYLFSGHQSRLIKPEAPDGAQEMRLRVVADTEWSATSYAPPAPLVFYYQDGTLLECESWIAIDAQDKDGRLDCGYSAWVPVNGQPEILQSLTYQPGYYWAYFEFKSSPVIESRVFIPFVAR